MPASPVPTFGYGTTSAERDARNEQAEKDAASIALLLLRRRRQALLALPVASATQTRAVLGRIDPAAYVAALRPRFEAAVAGLVGVSRVAFDDDVQTAILKVVQGALAGLGEADREAVLQVLALPVNERPGAIRDVVRAVTSRTSAGKVRIVKAPAVASMLAQTIVHHAASEVMQGVYVSIGVEWTRWACDKDPCETCKPANGLVRRIGDVFPSVNVAYSPAHPRCRCANLPAKAP